MAKDSWDEMGQLRKPPMTEDEARAAFTDRLAFAERHGATGIMIDTQAVRWAYGRIVKLEVIVQAARALRDHYDGAEGEITEDFMDWHIGAKQLREALWAALAAPGTPSGAVATTTGAGGPVPCQQCGALTDRPDRHNRCSRCAGATGAGARGE